MRPEPRVAVFSPNRDAPSETFIRAHIERLPLETVPIYGGGWQRRGARRPLWPVTRYPGWALGRLSASAGAAIYDRALAHRLRQFEVEVALAEYGMTGVEILGACRKARIPLVVHFHGFDASRADVIARYLREYQRMFAEASAIVAVSTPMRAQLIGWGAPEDKTHLNPYGADETRFAGASAGGVPSVFLAVGRFVAKKAPQLTVRAFRDVASIDPSARLIMVGDGPLLDPTRRLAQELGLGARVEFLGARSQEEVAALMRRARAFVQHSMTAPDGDSEGTPVSIIEAQMSGLPVISTRHAGIPEVVLQGETGFLVDEGDVQGMGRMMGMLAKEPGLAARLGEQARNRALARYTLGGHLERLADILRQAAAIMHCGRGG
jgi:colanic acid/amylovoran biosynthesis glycosyltransferase